MSTATSAFQLIFATFTILKSSNPSVIGPHITTMSAPTGRFVKASR
jgi:hypothetical protein